jgi:hypothetical protein
MMGINPDFELYKGEPNWTPEQQKIIQDTLNSIYRHVTNGICVAGREAKEYFCQKARDEINDLMYRHKVYPSDIEWKGQDEL